MIKVIKKERAKFRIFVHDLETKEARSITLTDGNEKVDDIKKIIIDCFDNRIKT